MGRQRAAKAYRYAASTFPPSSSIARWSPAPSPGGAAASSSADASPVETPAGFRRLRVVPAARNFLGFFSAIGNTYTRRARRKRKASGSTVLAIGPLLSVAYALLCYSRPGEPSREASRIRHLSVRYVHG